MGLPAQRRRGLPHPLGRLLADLDKDYQGTRSDRQQASLGLKKTLAALRRVACPPGLERVLIDLRAQAWGLLANARRAEGQLRRADRLWPRVRRLLAHGTGDLFLAAFLTELEASLRRGQRRFPEALALITQARVFYEALQEKQSLAGTFLRSALARYEAGDPVGAARDSLSAARLGLHRGRPQAASDLLHNLSLYLKDLGAIDLALGLLRRSLWLFRRTCDPQFHLRGLWLRGRLERELGLLREAVASFERARLGYLELGNTYDSALISLDLALIFAEQGLWQSLSRLVQEMYPVFVELDIPREAAASLMLFAQSAQQGRATTSLVLAALKELTPKPRVTPVEPG